MAKSLRVALIGGAAPIRKARRDALEQTGVGQVIYDGDGFQLTTAELLEINFDVAVIDHRLPSTSAFAFVTAAQALAKVSSVEIGRILISSQFCEMELRLAAIESGAVDCIFVDAGMEKFVSAVKACSEIDADFGIREILGDVPSGEVTEAEFRQASVALDTLDAKEAAIIQAFCELKSDAQIAQITKVPKFKVRNTIHKVQNLLMLNTRSQLLLKLTRLGALAL